MIHLEDYTFQLGKIKDVNEMNINTRKIGILGVGNVGSHCGYTLAAYGGADELILVDTKKDKANGEALDLMDSISFLPNNIKVKVGEEKDLSDSHILIISAGPLPGINQSRLDTLEDTLNTIVHSIDNIIENGFNGIILSISNPADVIADHILKRTNLSPKRVFSTGTSLDSARLRRILARELDVAYKSINAFSMGEHGSSQFIPWSKITIGNVGIEEYTRLKGIRLDFNSILEETRYAGYDVLKGKGSTEFGISQAATDIIRAIFHDERRIITVSTLLNGEYNQRGVFASVPCIIGKNGVEEIIQMDLRKEELMEFDDSCNVIREYIKIADKYLEV